jgi:hypothetical protein
MAHYEIHNYRHAVAVLRHGYPHEWDDITTVLADFRLHESDITTPGGRKSPISMWIDGALNPRGWEERQFNTSIVIETEGQPQQTHPNPTHKIDCYKNRVGLEVEWNNKDPFYDRDLNNFRILFELRVIDLGIIITRCDELQAIFESLGRGASYGASTTHMSKLLPRLDGQTAGGCPILVFGIRANLYVPSSGSGHLHS